MRGLLINLLKSLLDSENKINIPKPSINFKEGFRRIVAVCCFIGFICGVFAGEFVTALSCSVLCYIGYLCIEILLCWIGAGFSGKKKKRTFLKELQIKKKYWNRKCLRKHKENNADDEPKYGWVFRNYSLFFLKIKDKETALKEKENVIAISVGCVAAATVYVIVSALFGNKAILSDLEFMVVYAICLFWFYKKNSKIPAVIFFLLNLLIIFSVSILVLNNTRVSIIELLFIIPLFIVPFHMFKIANFLNEKKEEKTAFDVMKEMNKKDSDNQ